MANFHKARTPRPSLTFGLAALICIAIRAAAPAQPVSVEQLGPQVGSQVPGFSLPDQTGKLRTLQSVLGPKGALLVFFRSADW